MSGRRWNQHTTARITYRFDGATVFQVPYDREWVSLVKATVPAESRDWDPARREWAIWPPFGAAVIQLTRATFPDVVGPGPSHGGGTSREAPPDRNTSDAFVVLHLRETAPVELIEASYRVMARLHHPDVGGTEAQMKQINAAYDALKERVAS